MRLALALASASVFKLYNVSQYIVLYFIIEKFNKKIIKKIYILWFIRYSIAASRDVTQLWRAQLCLRGYTVQEYSM